MKRNCTFVDPKWIFLLILVILPVLLVNGQTQERDLAEDQPYHDQLEKISPEAVQHFKDATSAMDNKDTETAARKYRHVLVLAPDFVPAMRRLSYVTKDKGEARSLARKALKLENHPYNKLALLRQLFGSTMDKDIDEAFKLAKELAVDIPDNPQVHFFLAGLALDKQDDTLFKRSAYKLRMLSPGVMVAHYYAGIAAAMDEKWEESEAEILKAKALGLPAADADRILEKAGVSGKARNWRFFRIAFKGVIIWAVVLVILLLTGMLLSKVTLLAAEKQGPQGSGEPTGATRLMRRIYTIVLGLTSVYFYLSIPVVIVLVIGLGGGILYAFWEMGRIPIKLVAFIVIAIFATVGAMLKSLFVRPKDEDPGPKLTELEAPKLFAALREVSQKVGTAMVDTVFVVPGAEAAVFERGSLFRRLIGRTQRCLILGLGILEGMTQLQLKSILAHEFGHLNNKDTAGGSLALHVRRSILASAQAMAEAGVANWYNPAWLFMNAFHRVFLRISQGASRLQEILADRFAALAYGSKAFIQGLTHVIRRSPQFNLIANLEYDSFSINKTEIRNIYTLSVPDQWPKGEGDNGNRDKPEKTPAQIVDEAFKKAMETPTSPYDSHPAPFQRIELVKKMESSTDIIDNGEPAWGLLEDPGALQEKMSKQIMGDISNHWTRMAMARAAVEAANNK